MIIFQTKKPVESLSSNCIGVTGDNLAHTQEFYIKGVYDSTITYSLHLRFADGSVNTVVPDSVQHDGEGTGLRWVVKKNDIFMHGYFELQIEGRNEEGLVFQTEIVELYADESIPIEDKEYENPNSETLKLRDEAYKAMQTLTEQQAKIDETAQLLEQYDLSKKLDDEVGVIKTPHIGEEAITSEKISSGAVTSDKIEYGAVGEEELNSELLEKINSKADEATMLEALSTKLDNAEGGVQTEHIASKAITSDKIANGAITSMKIANNAVSSSCIAENQINSGHLTSGCITSVKLSDEVRQSIDSKAGKASTLSGYGITDAYTKTETDTALSGKLDNTEGAVTTENIADKAVATDKIADSAITSRKLAKNAVSANNIASYQIGADHIISGNITSDKLSDEVKQSISSKYDASNVETGTGTLTPHESHVSKINTATFEYQKVGDWVNLHIYVDLKAFTPASGESLMLSGLPYVCKNSVNPREMCVSTQKKQMLWAIASNSTSLTLLFFDTSAFVANEKLSFSLRYKIV